MTDVTASPLIDEAGPSRTEWLELFFDLVVVAAVALFTHTLASEPTWLGVAIFATLFAGTWLTWVSVVMYADVAGAQTRSTTVAVCMMAVAVMAASDPVNHPGRANAFAIGFLVVRLLLARAAVQTGRVLSSWPILQFGGFTLPWIAAMWIDPPWKYWIWAAALVTDIGLVLFRGDERAEKRLADLKRRHEESEAKRMADLERRPDRPRRANPNFELTPVDVDPDHLGERLGLFVIIVLGEAVAQLVLAGVDTNWHRPFVSAVTAGFLILYGLWQLTFSFGFSAAPAVRLGSLPPRYGLPIHLLSTAGIVMFAAGLGELVIEVGAGEEHLKAGVVWILCGGLALHFGVSFAVGLVGGSSQRWIWQFAFPSFVVVVLLGVLGTHVSPVALIWLLWCPVAWQFAFIVRALGFLRGRRDEEPA